MEDQSTNKFRNSTNARYLNALFFETAHRDKAPVLYTLKDEDHEGYPSLYRLYMETDDPTEYDFAKKYLEGWEHWTMLCNCDWFKPYVTRWRKELDLKLQSVALKSVIQEAKNGSFPAARILLEGKWREENKPQSPKRGRPSKDEVSKAAREEVARKKQVSQDAKRLGIET